MPNLVLGPVLRHVGETDATVWVETDERCRVEVLDGASETFHVDGHHYALVEVGGLRPGTEQPYEVLLDGEPRWPDSALVHPPSLIRTIGGERPQRIVFGSCRTSLPHEPPWLQSDGDEEEAHGIDALRALAHGMTRSEPEQWPDFLLMLGDQIYADELSPAMRKVTEERADGEMPATELGDFSEYALAYREAWGDPLIRWLLANVPSSMIFDDHEIHAEWKISQSWLDRMRGHDWYERRIAGGLASYWVYQQLGNLSPEELRSDDLYRRVRQAEDAGPLLREMAHGADREAGHSRWSFCRDLGRSRLIAIDSRAGRELDPGERRMVSEGEWSWIEESAEGDFDHLLLASSVPFFLVHGLHYLEAWNEAVCDGAWRGLGARLGEAIRQRAVLDHWASFGRSFHQLAGLLDHLSAGGESGRRPVSVIMLSGDVHHCYLSEVGFPPSGRERAPVWQAVCSPYRKRLSKLDRAVMRLGESRAGTAMGRLLARSARVAGMPVGWRLVERPTYDNQLGILSITETEARLRVATTAGSDWREPALTDVFEHVLA